MAHTTNPPTCYHLPARVQFATGLGNSGLVIAGTPGARGDAGYMVIRCRDRAHALELMAAHPAARMPGWARIERGEV